MPHLIIGVANERGHSHQHQGGPSKAPTAAVAAALHGVDAAAGLHGVAVTATLTTAAGVHDVAGTAIAITSHGMHAVGTALLPFTASVHATLPYNFTTATRPPT